MAQKKKQTGIMKPVAIGNAVEKWVEAYPITAIRSGLGSLAVELSNADMPVERRAEIFTALKALEDNLSDLKAAARKAVLAVATGSESIEVGASGTRKAQVAGFEFEVRRTGGNYDSKMVEALLRSKGGDPAKWMDVEVSYKVNLKRLDLLLKAPGTPVTQAELDTCKKPPDWAVQTPKKLSDE